MISSSSRICCSFSWIVVPVVVVVVLLVAVVVVDIVVVVLVVWLSDLVVSALGIRTRGPRFDSWVAPLLHWVATLDKLFAHIASTVSQLQETGVQKGSFWHLSGYGD